MAKPVYTICRTVRVKGPLPDPLPRVSAKGLIGGAIVLQEGPPHNTPPSAYRPRWVTLTFKQTYSSKPLHPGQP